MARICQARDLRVLNRRGELAPLFGPFRHGLAFSGDHRPVWIETSHSFADDPE